MKQFDGDINTTLLAMAMFATLKEDEGVAVHFQGKGYLVCKQYDEDARQVQVKIFEDEDMLQYNDRDLLHLHYDNIKVH